jgi:hypothetical protein
MVVHAYDPSLLRRWKQRIEFKASSSKVSKTLSQNKKHIKKRAGGMGQMVEYFHSIHEALGSMPSRRRERERERDFFDTTQVIWQSSFVSAYHLSVVHAYLCVQISLFYIGHTELHQPK